MGQSEHKLSADQTKILKQHEDQRKEAEKEHANLVKSLAVMDTWKVTEAALVVVPPRFIQEEVEPAFFVPKLDPVLDKKRSWLCRMAVRAILRKKELWHDFIDPDGTVSLDISSFPECFDLWNNIVIDPSEYLGWLEKKVEQIKGLRLYVKISDLLRERLTTSAEGTTDAAAPTVETAEPASAAAGDTTDPSNAKDLIRGSRKYADAVYKVFDKNRDKYYTAKELASELEKTFPSFPQHSPSRKAAIYKAVVMVRTDRQRYKDGHRIPKGAYMLPKNKKKRSATKKAPHRSKGGST